MEVQQESQPGCHLSWALKGEQEFYVKIKKTQSICQKEHIVRDGILLHVCLWCACMCICVFRGVYICVHVEDIGPCGKSSLIMLQLIYGGRVSHSSPVTTDSTSLINHLVLGSPVSASRVLGLEVGLHIHATFAQMLGILLLVWLSPLPRLRGSPGPSPPQQRRSGQSWPSTHRPI